MIVYCIKDTGVEVIILIQWTASIEGLCEYAYATRPVTLQNAQLSASNPWRPFFDDQQKEHVFKQRKSVTKLIWLPHDIRVAGGKFMWSAMLCLCRGTSCLEARLTLSFGVRSEIQPRCAVALFDLETGTTSTVLWIAGHLVRPSHAPEHVGLKLVNKINPFDAFTV